MAVFYLAHCTPTQSLKGKTLFEALYDHKPWVSNLCEYVCQDFVITQTRSIPRYMKDWKNAYLLGTP